MKKKKTERSVQKTQSAKSSQSAPRTPKNIVGWINWGCVVVFAAVVFYLMAVDGGNYLRKIESLSLFLPTSDFARECFLMPGGLLSWVSLWMTQAFYYPWLGAGVYCVLLLGMAVLALKAFLLSWRWFPSMLLPPAMTLLSLLDLGYLIVSLKTPGFAFLMPLGIIAVLGLFYGFRSLPKWWMRLVAEILLSVAGYHFLGFYGLLITGLSLCHEVASAVKSGEKWQCAVNAIAAAVLIFAVPRIWFTQIGGRLLLDRLYIIQLPRFFEDEWMMWGTYAVAAAAMMAMAFGAKLSKESNLSKLSNPSKVSIKSLVLPLLIATASVASIFLLRYNDANFRLTLDVDRALQNCEWQAASEMGMDMQEEPTRLNMFLRYAAMLRNGDAAERMFKLNVGAADPKTTRDVRATHDTGAIAHTYHLGMINYAYRWAMEYLVEYGRNVESLKYMAKCALINKEYKLAEKYLDILSLTAFHKDWAERFKRYVEKPELIKEEPEIASILPICTNEEYFIFDEGRLEGYTWPELAGITHGSDELLELSMLAALVCRDLQDFVDRMPYYVEHHERVPQHFQEAILLWSYAQKNEAWKECKVDKFTAQRFKDFVSFEESIANRSEEEKKEACKPLYGDTYWYYFVHVKGMKVI